MAPVSDSPLHSIRIGTLVPGDKAAAYIRQISHLGFESYELTFPPQVAAEGDLKAIAAESIEEAAAGGAIISSIGVYANPLGDLPEDAVALKGWERLIDHAEAFGVCVVCGFAGRVRGESIPDSIPRFAEVFGPLARRAEDRGVRIAFENCDMGGNWRQGDWNIAHNPTAWELMFNAIDSEALGLEWEPCHQMVHLIDPIPQLRRWVPRIFHVHGKDATIKWDVVREAGIGGAKPFVFHRTPGFGDTNWTDIISELRQQGFRGAIDIEGWHDPVYVGDLEMTGQVHALHYLKRCRGGAEFIPNPAS